MKALMVREQWEKYQEKRLNPKNDFLFKKLFAEEQGKPLLISLLNAILRRDGKEQIAAVTIIENKQLTREMIDDKEASLDVLCETDSDEKVNVEMQIHRFIRMDHRSLFYVASLFTGSIGYGEPYVKLKRSIGINILDHDYLPLKDFHNPFFIYAEKQRDYRLTDIIELHFLECTKFRKIAFDIHDPLHRWLRFLEQDIAPEQLKELMAMDETIKLAEARLQYLASDEETRLQYAAREKALRDRASWLEDARSEGIEQGIEQGIDKAQKKFKEEKLLMAKQLLDEGLHINKVADIIGLSTEEIQSFAICDSSGP